MGLSILGVVAGIAWCAVIAIMVRTYRNSDRSFIEHFSADGKTVDLLASTLAMFAITALICSVAGATIGAIGALIRHMRRLNP